MYESQNKLINRIFGTNKWINYY